MYDKLLKWSGIIGCCVLSVMIAGMLYYSSQKSLIYVHAEEESYVATEVQPDETVHGLNQIVPEEKENDWADYLRGATWALGQKHPLQVGLCGVIEGSLPIGGLSSSAAVIISFLAALCKVNNIHLSEHELIMIALSAENNYVGVSCGKLDQSCEVYSKKNHLLYFI